MNLLSSEVEFLQRQNQQENDLEKNYEGRIKIIILNCGIRYKKEIINRHIGSSLQKICWSIAL